MYESVRGTQESVEVTSYGQMNAIMEYGCYEIGIKEPKICKSQNKMISLKLEMNKEEKEKHLRTSYTLEELQDLESKIVLITGSAAENRKMVDLYVNVSFLGLEIISCMAERTQYL